MRSRIRRGGEGGGEEEVGGKMKYERDGSCFTREF